MPSVSEPSSLAEASEALAEASRGGRRVSIEREGGEFVLSTRGLDRILEHEAGDLTVTVEAGLRLTALNDRLAEHGQRLALDPPGDPTIGAVIAGDLFGPLAFRYGRARDLLLGVTVVLADGTVANAGGKVVKNVAGYDLGKLFCDSRGRLGLIGRASFRLHPLPEAARTLVFDITSPDEAQGALRALLHSELVPSAADLIWPGRLAVLFEGSQRAVAAQCEQATELLGGGEDGDGVWDEARARQASASGRRAFGGAELASVLAELDEGLVRFGPTCFAFGSNINDQISNKMSWSGTSERLRSELDPAGTLV